MTEQKSSDQATGEGMPEALTARETKRVLAAQTLAKEQANAQQNLQPPPVSNENVAQGAQQFDSPPPPVGGGLVGGGFRNPGPPPRTGSGQTRDLRAAASEEVVHLHDRVREMEEAVHTFLTHNASVGHIKVVTWLDKVKARIHGATAPSPATPSPTSSSNKQGEDPAP